MIRWAMSRLFGVRFAAIEFAGEYVIRRIRADPWGREYGRAYGISLYRTDRRWKELWPREAKPSNAEGVQTQSEDK